MIIKEFLLTRRWIILTFSFALVTLTASAYLFYREIYRPKKPNDILSKYSHLFRQQIDMDILNQLIRSEKRLDVKETHKPTGDTCTLSCNNDNDKNINRYNRAAQYSDIQEINSTDIVLLENKTFNGENVSYNEPVAAALHDEPRIVYSYHGCCVSYQKYISPTSLDDALTGRKLRIIQYRKKKQYFLTDNCKQAKECNRGCQCKQQFVTGVAVVVDIGTPDTIFDEDHENDYIEKHARIELVKYPGWCKCFNS